MALDQLAGNEVDSKDSFVKITGACPHKSPIQIKSKNVINSILQQKKNIVFCLELLIVCPKTLPNFKKKFIREQKSAEYLNLEGIIVVVFFVLIIDY